MINLEGKQYYTARELAREVGVEKTYICRLARDGRLRHLRTDLGYLFSADTVKEDWLNRKVRQ